MPTRPQRLNWWKSGGPAAVRTNAARSMTAIAIVITAATRVRKAARSPRPPPAKAARAPRASSGIAAAAVTTSFAKHARAHRPMPPLHRQPKARRPRKRVRKTVKKIAPIGVRRASASRARAATTTTAAKNPAAIATRVIATRAIATDSRDKGRDFGGRDKGGRDKRDSGPSHRQWATSAAPRDRDRPVDPNSPFAKLAALKEQLAGRKE